MSAEEDGVRSVFRGRLIEVRLETAEYPDGSRGELEIVRHPGAAAVVAVEARTREPGGGECDDGTRWDVLLLRQYRHAADGFIWEIPAGTLEGDETPASCARRELREETGARARNVESLGALWTTPGFTDERIHLFLATDLTLGQRRTEKQEFLDVHRVPLERAVAMIDRGEIEDGKTVAALLLVARRLTGEG